MEEKADEKYREGEREKPMEANNTEFSASSEKEEQPWTGQ